MGPKQKCTSETLVLMFFKRLIALGAAAVVLSSTALTSVAFAKEQEGLSLLFKNSNLQLGQHSQCEVYAPGYGAVRASKYLHQDIAVVLQAMANGPVSIQSECEAVGKIKRHCSVAFTLSRGELNWSRYYQFDYFDVGAQAKNANRQSLRNLKCFIVP
jgi:hypothetical protein